MKVVAQQWVSLDGFASGLEGLDELFAAVPEPADLASQRWNDRLLDDVDFVMLGRKTYEGFVEYWPGSDEPIARRVNGIPKVVCSRNLESAPWGDFPAALVERDAVSYLRALRDSAGTALIWGSLSLMHDILGAGELDELDLFVAAVALGRGTPLLPMPGIRLRQLDAEAFPGAVHVRYAITGPQ